MRALHPRILPLHRLYTVPASPPRTSHRQTPFVLTTLIKLSTLSELSLDGSQSRAPLGRSTSSDSYCRSGPLFPFFATKNLLSPARLDQVWTALTSNLSMSRQGMSQSFPSGIPRRRNSKDCRSFVFPSRNWSIYVLEAVSWLLFCFVGFKVVLRIELTSIVAL